MDKDTAKDHVKGKFNEAAGETREQIGKATGNEEMEREGHDQEMKGKLQGKAADLKEAGNDVKDAAKQVIR